MRMTMEADLAGEEPRSEVDSRKKVVVIGAGWAGLAAAYELSKQVRTCSCVEVTQNAEVASFEF